MGNHVIQSLDVSDEELEAQKSMSLDKAIDQAPESQLYDIQNWLFPPFATYSLTELQSSLIK